MIFVPHVRRISMAYSKSSSPTTVLAHITRLITSWRFISWLNFSRKAIAGQRGFGSSPQDLRATRIWIYPIEFLKKLWSLLSNDYSENFGCISKRFFIYAKNNFSRS